MGSADQFQPVRFRKLIHSRFPKNEACPAGRLTKPIHVVGVRPDQIGKRPGRGDFLGAWNGSNLGMTKIGGIFYLVNCVDGRRKAPVDAENAVVDELYSREEEKRIRLQRLNNRRLR